MIQSRFTQNLIEAESSGTAIPHISITHFGRFPVQLPPLAEQQEIVRRVEKLFAFADQIEARLKLAQKHVDRITQSLLAKAFRGELVPTEHTLATAAGRDYESAAVLLARVAASKPSEAKTTARERRKFNKKSVAAK